MVATRSATSHSAGAAEIKVLSSGGFRAAYLALAAEFERASGHRVESTWGGSMGSAPTTIPNRLARGEIADVVILAVDSLDQLVQQGKLVAASRVDLARSTIGVAVPSGGPRPDLGSVDGFKRSLIAAMSIAYSSSASGLYLERLFQRLGIADKLDIRKVQGEPVAAVVARGEAAIGLQQVSELLPVPGIDFVGPIPAEIQEITIFSAAVPVNARSPDAAAALIQFLASPQAHRFIRSSGMEPI